MKSQSVESLMNLITEAIQFKFASDPSSPGLLISKLKTGDRYVSVVRFKSAFGKDKVVAFKAREPSLLEALSNVAKQIANDGANARNPVDELRAQLGV